RKINGVGEKTEKKLLDIGVKYFSDLQKIKMNELIKVFGKYGENLYELCRGKDDRQVENNRISKSLSVEDTYFDDINSVKESVAELKKIYEKLLLRLNSKKEDIFSIKSCFVKIKFNDFKTISNQKSSMTYEYDIFENLLIKMLSENKKPIRLIGAGVQFSNNSQLRLNIF
ncbi:MAG: DNA polymerase IV, partial [Pseudomonadota bacterium]|nr:DNA polymerase IV [Pseudomonadota bacterium]